MGFTFMSLLQLCTCNFSFQSSRTSPTGPIQTVITILIGVLPCKAGKQHVPILSDQLPPFTRGWLKPDGFLTGLASLLPTAVANIPQTGPPVQVHHTFSYKTDITNRKSKLKNWFVMIFFYVIGNCRKHPLITVAAQCLVLPLEWAIIITVIMISPHPLISVLIVCLRAFPGRCSGTAPA